MDTPQEPLGFDEPNYTQTPNVFFEDMMKLMGESELKVMLCAIRQTFGYHKQHDPISLTQFQRMTGLSRQGVLDGIEKAVRRGYLVPIGNGTRGVTIYMVRVAGSPRLVNKVDQSKSLTSQQSRPELVNKVDTQKKRKERKDSIASATQIADTPALKKSKQRSPKQLANDAEMKRKALALGSALGIPPVESEEKAYFQVYSALVKAGIPESEFTAYMTWLRAKAQSEGGWTITLHALTKPGRPSEYSAQRRSPAPAASNGAHAHQPAQLQPFE
jgi:hypothetical protein